MYGKTVAEFFNTFKKQKFLKWVSKEKYEEEMKKPKGEGRYPILTEPLNELESLEDANLMTSRCMNGNHILVVDLDVEAYLIPSSTPGHSHLIINKEMTWWDLRKILDALVDADVVEPGYLRAADKQNATAIRLPWEKKNRDEPWFQDD